MEEWVDVEKARIASGNEFVLARRDDDWAVRVDGRMLMSSRMHHSEIELAERGLALAGDPRSVLVGGLGLGFTLRAVLDRLPDDGHVVVAELVPEIVTWNRTYLAALHDHALDDPRCTVAVGDVFETLRSSTGKFDVILLDVDNGPQALSQARNQRLYSDGGIRTCRAALAPDGVLAVWAVGTSARYKKKVASHGFDVEEQRVPAREGGRAAHVLFLATKI